MSTKQIYWKVTKWQNVKQKPDCHYHISWNLVFRLHWLAILSDIKTHLVTAQMLMIKHFQVFFVWSLSSCFIEHVEWRKIGLCCIYICLLIEVWNWSRISEFQLLTVVVNNWNSSRWRYLNLFKLIKFAAFRQRLRNSIAGFKHIDMTSIIVLMISNLRKTFSRSISSTTFCLCITSEPGWDRHTQPTCHLEPERDVTRTENDITTVWSEQ